jgi:hypothetical protein
LFPAAKCAKHLTVNNVMTGANLTVDGGNNA